MELFPSIAFGNDLNHSLQQKNGLPVVSDRWMVSAANPYAVEAGAKILAQGGSAADAMVAVQSVLGLVEPQSSGIGGGAFLIWFDATSGRITTLMGVKLHHDTSHLNFFRTAPVTVKIL